MYQLLTLLVVFGASNGQFFHGGYVPTPVAPPVHPFLHQYLSRSAYGSSSGQDDDVLRLLYSECSTAYRDYICDKRPSGFWEVWVAPSCQKYEKPAYKPVYEPPAYEPPAYKPPTYTTPAYTTRPPYTTPKPYMTPKPYNPPSYEPDVKPYSLFSPQRSGYQVPSYGGSSGTKVAAPRDITMKDVETCLKSFVEFYCDQTKDSYHKVPASWCGGY